MRSALAEAAGAVVTLGLVGGALGLAARLRRRGVEPELTRKAAHLGTALAVLPMPWLIHEPLTIAAMVSAACATVALLRHKGRLGFLDDVERSHWSEYAYVAAIALTFVGSRGQPHRFVATVLVLGISDAAAALVGSRWGAHRFAVHGGRRSLEGSLAFALTAFAVICAATLALGGELSAQVMADAALAALIGAAVEAVSMGGLDNLAVPMVVLASLSATGLDVGRWLEAAAAGAAACVAGWRWVSPARSAAVGLVAYGALAAAASAWWLGLTLTAIGAAQLLAPPQSERVRA